MVVCHCLQSTNRSLCNRRIPPISPLPAKWTLVAHQVEVDLHPGWAGVSCFLQLPQLLVILLCIKSPVESGSGVREVRKDLAVATIPFESGEVWALCFVPNCLAQPVETLHCFIEIPKNKLGIQQCSNKYPQRKQLQGMDSFFSGSKSFQIVQVYSKSVTLRSCESAEILEQRDLLLPLALIRYVITKDEL